MLKLDPSPWLLFTIPILIAVGYVTWRGLAKNEFLDRSKVGWERHPKYSFGWCVATLLNFTFLSAFCFMNYQALVTGADFSREPELPMPPLGGQIVGSVRAAKTPQLLAECITDINHGESFDLGNDNWRVVVRNGRNAILNTFEIRPDGSGSHMDIRAWGISPFVSWNRCLAPANQRTNLGV